MEKTARNALEEPRGVHILKILPKYFRAQAKGKKNFEIRRNDRNFNVGDELWLREYDPKAEAYTENSLVVKVTYITSYMQQKDYVVLGTKLEAFVCSRCHDECEPEETTKLSNGEYICDFCKFVLKEDEQ